MRAILENTFSRVLNIGYSNFNDSSVTRFLIGSWTSALAILGAKNRH